MAIFYRGVDNHILWQANFESNRARSQTVVQLEGTTVFFVGRHNKRRQVYRQFLCKLYIIHYMLVDYSSPLQQVFLDHPSADAIVSNDRRRRFSR
jgi:hypothetical protein